ncbi:hypothetical protein MHU86_23233 [Fragilaria crotonensis]|nr:hypothetical protein MHU86_23233 [Fragilaria crotonensis]
MLRYYEQHNMVLRRMNNLHESHHSMSHEEVRTILAAWDNDQGHAMESAEKALRRPPKKYQWSPKLGNAAILQRYWKLRLLECQKGDNYQQTFARWQSESQVHNPSFALPSFGENLSVETVRKCLNAATREFRKSQRSATNLRLQTDQDLLETYEDDIDPCTRT